MRYSILCAVTLLVSGCALPIPFQIASWAASGFSYATTGKSISDHAVSAVAEKDCALHRIALGENICSPGETDGTALAEAEPAVAEQNSEQMAATAPTERLRDSLIALAENLENDLQPASGEPETTQPLDSALLAMADTLNAIDRKEGGPVLSNESGNHYLVIGQYRVLEEAEKIRTKHSILGTKIRMILKSGTLLYQVTAGPFSQPGATGLEARLDKQGLSTTIALLCADGVTPAPCQQIPENSVRLTLAPARGPQFTK